MNTPNKTVYDISQSGISLNENNTVNLPNEETATEQGPTNYEGKWSCRKCAPWGC